MARKNSNPQDSLTDEHEIAVDTDEGEDEGSELLDPNDDDSQLGPDEDEIGEEDATGDSDDEEDDIPATNPDGTRNVVLKTGITADKASSAKAPFTGVERTYRQVFVMPGTVQGYIDRYGEETILDLIESSVVARTRAAARKPLEEGWPDSEIAALCLERSNNFGTRKSRTPRDPKAAIRQKLSSIEDPEERKAFLAELASELGL